MRLQVKVKANAKRDAIEPGPDGILKVSVTAPPTQGKANTKVISLLAAHFGVPKSSVQIRHGAGSSRKLIEIDK